MKRKSEPKKISASLDIEQHLENEDSEDNQDKAKTAKKKSPKDAKAPERSSTRERKVPEILTPSNPIKKKREKKNQDKTGEGERKEKKADKKSQEKNMNGKEKKEDCNDEKKEEVFEKDDKVNSLKKKKKKLIPAWATLDGKSSLNLKKVQSVHSAFEVITEAIRASADAKGVASIMSIKKYVRSKCPHWPKMTFKRSVKKALDSKRIVQVSGHGLTGSFRFGPGKEVTKSTTKNNLKSKRNKTNKSSSKINDLPPLEDLFPNIFTWVCEPKESSSQWIKKYVGKHFPELKVEEGKGFANALSHGVDKGQLRQITGVGSSGTFQLIDGARKTGGKFEDAIEDAIIATNEPKDASVSSLRNYLHQYHTEYDIDNRPLRLLKSLERCSEKGFIKRLSGKGFSGSFRLAFQYHPSPRELWGQWYEGGEDADKKGDTAKRSKTVENGKKKNSSKKEDEDDYSSDEEYVPKKRGAPKMRKPLPEKKERISTSTEGRRRKH